MDILHITKKGRWKNNHLQLETKGNTPFIYLFYYFHYFDVVSTVLLDKELVTRSFLLCFLRFSKRC
jgi:hypothetical protein